MSFNITGQVGSDHWKIRTYKTMLTIYRSINYLAITLRLRKKIKTYLRSTDTIDGPSIK